MADNLSEIRTIVQSDLNVTSSSSQFPPATIDSAINRAYRSGGSLFKWPALQDAKKTVTELNINYADAPTNWRPNSIWRLTIDGEPYGDEPDYSPLKFKDFLDWLDDDNAILTEKHWSVQWLRYFFNPTPSQAGLEICIWGQENVEKLTADNSETIFTDNLPECNDAIAKEATAILKHKGELPKTGELFSAEAKTIFALAFGKIKKESGKYVKVYPFLNVPNFFGPTLQGEDLTGRF